MEMVSSPDFAVLTTQRHENAAIGNFADLAYLIQPTVIHIILDGQTRQGILECMSGEKLPVNPRQCISKIGKPLALLEFFLPEVICARVVCHTGYFAAG
jgi:hypothetical protein